MDVFWVDKVGLRDGSDNDWLVDKDEFWVWWLLVSLDEEKVKEEFWFCRRLSISSSSPLIWAFLSDIDFVLSSIDCLDLDNKDLYFDINYLSYEIIGRKWRSQKS